MGKRENKVENHLTDQIKHHFNGDTRKWVSPGRDGVPDRICFIDPEWYVEVKTVDGKLSESQKRECLRLVNLGARVAVVYGEAGVDSFIDWLMVNKNIQAKMILEFL